MNKKGPKVTYNTRTQRLIFENGIILREFQTSPRFGTIRYQYTFACDKNLVESNPASKHFSKEAILMINGKTVCIGGDGETRLFQFNNYSTERLKDGGLILHIWLCSDSREIGPGIKIGLHYQLGVQSFYLIKWLTVQTERKGEAVVDGVCPEALTMPMPSGALRMVQPTFIHRSSRWRSLSNPIRYRNIDKSFKVHADSPIFFLDRHSETSATGFSLVTDYANIIEGLDLGDGVTGIGGSIIESNVSYSCEGGPLGTKVISETIISYGIGPDVLVAPDSSFESFKTYECFFTGGFEDGALAFKNMLQELCPWISHNRLSFVLNKVVPFEECLKSIDHVSKIGFEKWRPAQGTILAKDTGTFEINQKCFPQGIKQIREMIEHAHSKGVKVTIYFALQGGIWDLRESELILSNDWQLTRKDGLTFYHYALGAERPTGACLASGYGEYITPKCVEFLKETGLDGIETDGPYDGLLCYSLKHYHRSPANSQYMQWEVQRKFYHTLRKSGFFLNAPSSLCAIFHGNGPLPVGAECWKVSSADDAERGMEQLYNKWDQVITVRQDLWYSSFIFPPTVMRHSLSTWNTLEKQSEEFLEHWLATLLGYGVQSTFVGDINERNERCFKKWLTFFKHYRAILESDIIHLRYPDGMSIDAIMHVNSKVIPPAFIMVYNPTGLTLQQSIVIPTKYLPGGKKIRIKGKDEKMLFLKVEDRVISPGIVEGDVFPGKVVVLDVCLAPYEITWFEVIN